MDGPAERKRPEVNDDRERILEAVRRALRPLGASRAPYPAYRSAEVLSRGTAEAEPSALFAERLARVKGRLFAEPAELSAFLREQGCVRGYCDAALRRRLDPFWQGLDVTSLYTREAVDTLEFAVTATAGAIAESGSIILTDASVPNRLAALAPWIHIAVVDPRSLHRDIPSALAALGTDPYVVWVSGPSKTADVEGILIEGVHGPGVQGVLFLEGG